MADDNDGNRRKANSDKTPDWNETCIGIWSRSTKGQHDNEGDHDKICNGISVVRIHGKVSLRLQSFNKRTTQEIFKHIHNIKIFCC